MRVLVKTHFFLSAVVVALPLLLVACPNPKVPAGTPPPEYEDPPANSWKQPAPPPPPPPVDTAPPPPPPFTTRHLDPNIQGFTAENRARLDKLLDEKGKASSGYDPAHKPIATFDWDNTMMKGDIGDATMATILAKDAILQPPGKDWSKTSGALTAAAKAALKAACDNAGAEGKPLATSKTPACAGEIFSIYADGKTKKGAAAWTKEITTTSKEPYAWAARLLVGIKPEDLHAYAKAAYESDSKAAPGATRAIGTYTGVTAWVRIYDPMRDLVGALQTDGFDVWVVSASPQNVVEVPASEVGIASDHVIGIKNKLRADGTFDSHIDDCGGAPADGIITFDRGKRCFINKVILGVPEKDALAVAPADKRQVFAAGDADTDVAFVQDATTLKLVIERQKTALMCNALANAGNKWLVQPMFIEPMPAKTTPYPCATTKDGDGIPIKDENGMPIPDQKPVTK